MPYPRPPLKTIIERKQSDIESRLPGSDPRLQTTVLSIMARAVSASEHSLYGHQEYISKQIIPDTASLEHLERQAFWLCGEMTLTDAEKAGDVINLVGNDGALIPADRALQRSDGVEFTTDEEVTIAAGVAVVKVTASEAGQIGNTTAGTVLQFISPITDVNSQATVGVNGLSGGADVETGPQLLIRMREYMRSRRNGVNLAQYEVWAREVPGVTRAWAFDLWFGAGTVALFFVRDDDANFIPDAGEIQAMQDYIDFRRPPGMAGFSALAPVEVLQNLTIQLTPNTTEVQAAVVAELNDMFVRNSTVEDGVGSGALLVSHLREAISTAAGETDHVLVSPVANITLNAGEIATLGMVTWQ